MGHRSRARHLAEYLLVRALVTAVLSAGLPAAIRISRLLADVLFRLDEKHRERALKHLRAAFPGLGAEERRALARGSFRSFARTIVEAAYLPRVLHRATLREHVRVEADPEARRALAGGGGAVFTSAHIGNWEFCGAAMALVGYPLTSVARPLDNPFLDRWVVRLREHLGQEIIFKEGASREMLRVIRRGGYLAVLVDQSAGRHGIPVPFFGRPASTTPAPAALALRRGVPLVPVWSKRLPGVGRFRVSIERPLAAPAGGDREAAVRELTAALTARVEAWIREAPDQWLWAHRRWKRKSKEGTP